MAVLETWDSKSGCACNECQTWSRAARAIPLERKEPWQAAGPFAQQLSAAALDAALAPLAARVAALEARVIAPVEAASVVYRYAAPHEPADALLQCVSGAVGLVLIR